MNRDSYLKISKNFFSLKSDRKEMKEKVTNVLQLGNAPNDVEKKSAIFPRLPVCQTLNLSRFVTSFNV